MAIKIRPRIPSGRVHLTLPAPALQQVDALARKHRANRCDVIRSLVEAALEEVAAEATTG